MIHKLSSGCQRRWIVGIFASWFEESSTVVLFYIFDSVLRFFIIEAKIRSIFNQYAVCPDGVVKAEKNPPANAFSGVKNYFDIVTSNCLIFVDDLI